MAVNFSIVRSGERQYEDYYFREDEPHAFYRHEEEMIKQEFVENAKATIEGLSAKGSGWALERIMVACVNVAGYQPLNEGTYLPHPASLANKKAIINVRNKDNECLK